MTRRTKIIIAIVIIVLILVALLLFWLRFFTNRGTPAVVVVEEEVAGQESVTTTPPIAQIPAEEPRTNTEVSIESLSLTFTERYGSYSNESNFANLDDLEPLMTSRLQAELAALAASTTVDDVYYGITTRVISINTISLDETTGSATVEVLTQREEAIGSPLNAEVRYETMVLELLKQGGVWKVDDATWK